jgi:formylglycine-generating enzyme required for sulfatase activity
LGSGDPYESDEVLDTTPIGFYNGELHHKVDFGWPGSATSYQTQDAQSYYGAYDLSGNVNEWCNDWFGSSYYSSSPYDNPTGPESGGARVLRGGGWGYEPRNVRSAVRHWYPPYHHNGNSGFRCAMGMP